MYKMASTGRDFPGKVRPMAFSNCRRPRKNSNITPGGQVFCLPTAAVTYHRPRFILMAPSQGNWKCTVSGECEMTISGKIQMPRLRGRGCPASAPVTQESRGRLPSSPGLPAITGSIKAAATYSPTWWGSTIGARGLNFSVRYERWVPAAIAAAVYHNERDERGFPQSICPT